MKNILNAFLALSQVNEHLNAHLPSFFNLLLKSKRELNVCKLWYSTIGELFFFLLGMQSSSATV